MLKLSTSFVATSEVGLTADELLLHVIIKFRRQILIVINNSTFEALFNYIPQESSAACRISPDVPDGKSPITYITPDLQECSPPLELPLIIPLDD